MEKCVAESPIHDTECRNRGKGKEGKVEDCTAVYIVRCKWAEFHSCRSDDVEMIQRVEGGAIEFNYVIIPCREDDMVLLIRHTLQQNTASIQINKRSVHSFYSGMCVCATKRSL